MKLAPRTFRRRLAPLDAAAGQRPAPHPAVTVAHQQHLARRVAHDHLGAARCDVEPRQHPSPEPRR